jgi:hypothetical protein
MRKKVLITALSLVLCLSIAFIVTSRASINPEIPNVIAGMWKYTTSNGQVGQIRFDAITAGQVFDPRIGTGTFGAGKWTIGTNRLDSPITFAAGTMPAGSSTARIVVEFYKNGGKWMFKGKVFWNSDQRYHALFNGVKM